MKKTMIAVAVGFAVLWGAVALMMQGETAKAREAEARAAALHQKTMENEAAARKAELDRLDGK